MTNLFKNHKNNKWSLSQDSGISSRGIEKNILPLFNGRELMIGVG